MNNELLTEQLEKLREKYENMGQDMNSYLDGLLLSNYVPYWEYARLDTLMSLQQPKTDFPDELIFIVYHQITELYFRLSLHEFEQIANNGRMVLPNGEDKGWNDKLEPGFLKKGCEESTNIFERLPPATA